MESNFAFHKHIPFIVGRSTAFLLNTFEVSSLLLLICFLCLTCFTRGRHISWQDFPNVLLISASLFLSQPCVCHVLSIRILFKNKKNSFFLLKIVVMLTMEHLFSILEFQRLLEECRKWMCISVMPLLFNKIFSQTQSEEFTYRHNVVDEVL